MAIYAIKSSKLLKNTIFSRLQIQVVLMLRMKIIFSMLFL